MSRRLRLGVKRHSLCAGVPTSLCRIKRRQSRHKAQYSFTDKPSALLRRHETKWTPSTRVPLARLDRIRVVWQTLAALDPPLVTRTLRSPLGKRSMVGTLRRSHRTVTVLCFPIFLATGLGCAQTTMLRDRAALSGKAFVDAVAPVLDPAGGSVSPQGRSVERSLSRSGGY